MNRCEKLLSARMTKVGLFYILKRWRGQSRKRAVIEISQALGVGIHTVNNDLKKYKSRSIDATKINNMNNY